MSTSSRASGRCETHDPFNNDLILCNLASLVGNYADDGAELLVLAWVVQDNYALVQLDEGVGTSVLGLVTK